MNLNLGIKSIKSTITCALISQFIRDFLVLKTQNLPQKHIQIQTMADELVSRVKHQRHLVVISDFADSFDIAARQAFSKKQQAPTTLL